MYSKSIWTDSQKKIKQQPQVKYIQIGRGNFQRIKRLKYLGSIMANVEIISYDIKEILTKANVMELSYS